MQSAVGEALKIQLADRSCCLTVLDGETFLRLDIRNDEVKCDLGFDGEETKAS